MNQTKEQTVANSKKRKLYFGKSLRKKTGIGYGLKRRKTTWKQFNIAFTRTIKQILTIDLVRYIVCYVRRLYYFKLLGKTRVYQGNLSSVNKHTIAHNTTGAFSDVAVIRSNQLIKPLSILAPIRHRLEQVKVLSIGPRTEGERFNLIANGFSPKKIRGLDLATYSPLIDVGDMHKMPYRNDVFDVIISGWVLSYSEDKKLAAKEMVRVAKDKAIMAIGVLYSNKTYENKLKQARGYEIPEELFSVKDILALFGNHVDKVYFSQDMTEEDKKRGENLLAIFSIKK